MKRTNVMMKYTLLLALGLSTTTFFAQDVRQVDPASSKLIWTATKVTGSHTGHVTLASGSIILNGTDLGAADMVVDMKTITCTDLQGGGAERLVAHLNSADFFDTGNHTNATFKTTRVEKIADAPAGKPNYRVTGDLTIKGITQPNTFDLLMWMDGQAVRAAANLVFDRTKYDIHYRSGSFFPDLGDKVISDEVSLTFDIKTL